VFSKEKWNIYIEDMLEACDELNFYAKYASKRSDLLAESALQVFLAAREIRRNGPRSKLLRLDIHVDGKERLLEKM